MLYFYLFHSVFKVTPQFKFLPKKNRPVRLIVDCHLHLNVFRSYLNLPDVQIYTNIYFVHGRPVAMFSLFTLILFILLPFSSVSHKTAINETVWNV